MNPPGNESELLLHIWGRTTSTLAFARSLSLSLSLISLTFTKDNWEKPLLILEKMIFPPLYINLEKSKINKDKTGEGTPRILLICHPLHFCKIYLV